jgi:L-threonylcarbamoyladenylate synthase
MKRAAILLQDNLEKIVEAFSKGKVACIPTDTIYAMSCDAMNVDAIERIYQIKKRDLNKTLPVFVADIEMAKEYIKFFSKELALTEVFWPGALTFVSEINNQKIPKILINKNKIAIRVPKCKLIQNICKSLNKPIIATSANISAQSSIICVDEIIKNFHHKVDCILEDFNMNKKNDLTPSTIIEFINEDKFKIIRTGKISEDELNKVIN